MRHKIACRLQVICFVNTPFSWNENREFLFQSQCWQHCQGLMDLVYGDRKIQIDMGTWQQFVYFRRLNNSLTGRHLSSDMWYINSHIWYVFYEYSTSIQRIQYTSLSIIKKISHNFENAFLEINQNNFGGILWVLTLTFYEIIWRHCL